MLKNLQLEYAVFELRKEIYTNENDLSFFDKVLISKKRRILDIGLKNSVETIFSSPDIKTAIYKEIYVKPYPNFRYRGVEEEARFKALDEYYYYSQAAEFYDFNKNLYLLDGFKDEKCIAIDLNNGNKYELEMKEIFRKLKGYDY